MKKVFLLANCDALVEVESAKRLARLKCASLPGSDKRATSCSFKINYGNRIVLRRITRYELIFGTGSFKGIAIWEKTDDGIQITINLDRAKSRGIVLTDNGKWLDEFIFDLIQHAGWEIKNGFNQYASAERVTLVNRDYNNITKK